ncbi:MAG: hypothetical protein ACYC64_16950 [Armatimonadota bacterium]
MKRYSVLLFVVVLMLGTTLAANAIQVDPTNGWTLDVSPSANGVVSITPLIDNLEVLKGLSGLYSKTWTDIDLGGGAMLQYLMMGVDADPVITLNFVVLSGTSNTSFTISSALLSFPAINAEGTASAGVTVTDINGDTATATGLIPGSKFYEAAYNGSSVFAKLVTSPIVAAAYGSTTGSENVPPWVGMGSVSSMQSKFSFSLTPGDSASGTSVYTIREVPEPTCLGVLAMGLVGLAAGRRRF